MMSKIFLICYRNITSMYMEIFELTDDNIKYNKPWRVSINIDEAMFIHAGDVNYNPQRQMLYNEFICALVKRYGNQTIEDITSLPLTRILDLAGNTRYPYNNGFYYICEASDVIGAVLKFDMVMNKEE